MAKRSRNNNNNKNNSLVKPAVPNTVGNVAVVAKSKHVKIQKPIVKMGRDCTIVTHREYIADVNSASSAFQVQKYSINPGISTTFPWLSSVANRFESYLFDRLTFSYEPICPTNTAGSVILSVDYDANDPAPNNKVTAMAYSGAVRTSPWDLVNFNAYKSDLSKFGVQRYTRAANVTGDIKTYDIGSLFVCTSSTPTAATTLGELYVEYTCKFYTPQLSPVSGGNERNSQQFILSFNNATKQIIGNSIVSGVAENPLAWIYSVVGTGDELTAIVAFKTDNNYLIEAEARATFNASGETPGNLFDYFATPNNPPAPLTGSTNFNAFWDLEYPMQFSDPNGSVNGFMVGGYGAQPNEQVNNAPYNLIGVKLQTIAHDLLKDDGRMALIMNIVPIDGPTASILQHVRTAFSSLTFNWDINNLVNAPQLFQRATDDRDGMIYNQEFN
jgi:hypothetical protein